MRTECMKSRVSASELSVVKRFYLCFNTYINWKEKEERIRLQEGGNPTVRYFEALNAQHYERKIFVVCTYSNCYKECYAPYNMPPINSSPYSNNSKKVAVDTFVVTSIQYS